MGTPKIIPLEIMKTTISLFFISILSLYTTAQDAASKNVQAGLVFGSGLNFQELKTDYFSSGGTGTDLTVGMNFNFNFTETIGLCTGAEFDFSNTFYDADSNVFYHYSDKRIIQNGDYDPSETYGTFLMESRKDKSIYLTVPTMFLFRTKFIGYFRYFGKFGLKNSFLLKTESFDTGRDFGTGTIIGTDPLVTSKDNMTTKGNMFFYKGAIGIAGGAEWNFSGSTSLVGEIGYYYGITPLYWERETDHEKLSLFTSGFNNGKGNDVYNPIKARQSQLMLKVSVLF